MTRHVTAPLPGIAVLLGGVLPAVSRNRAAAWLAAALALAGGVWFAPAG